MSINKTQVFHSTTKGQVLSVRFKRIIGSLGLICFCSILPAQAVAQNASTTEQKPPTQQQASKPDATEAAKADSKSSAASVMPINSLGAGEGLSEGHMVQTTMGMLLILGLLFGLLWALRRSGVVPKGKSRNFYKIIAVQSLGQKEKIALLEIGDTWLVVGMTAHSINTLHTMPKDSLDLNTEQVNPAATFAKLLERIKSPQVKS